MSFDDPTQLDPALFTKSEQRQLQHLMRRLGMTVWQVISMAREQVLSEIDPAPGEGDRFEFHRPDFITAEYFTASAVPAPDANVDLITALHICDRDTQNAAVLLNDDDRGSKLPIDALWQVLLNTRDWQRFLAVRDPDPIGRRRAAVIATECERIMNRLSLKAEAALAKRRPYNPADYFTDEASLPRPASSPLLGAEGHAEATRKHKAEIIERRRAIHEVPKATPQRLSTVKPKPGKDTLQ
jgi:hypothetical protein